MRTGVILWAWPPQGVPLSVIRRRRVGARAPLCLGVRRTFCPLRIGQEDSGCKANARRLRRNLYVPMRGNSRQSGLPYSSALKSFFPALAKAAGTDAETEHQSVSWKAYLAARERQHLASDIVEGFFNAPEGGGPLQRRQARDPVVQGVRQGLAGAHSAARSHRAGTCASRFHGRAAYRSLSNRHLPPSDERPFGRRGILLWKL